MAIKSNFNMAKAMNNAEKHKEILFQKILNSYIMAGEQFVIDSREQPQGHDKGFYDDQTTNLRNSIAYFVFYDGELIKENQKGNAVVNKGIVQEYANPKGFQLIGIAGMNYASHVESKGYNVISNQVDLCVVNLTGYLKELNIKENG